MKKPETWKDIITKHEPLNKTYHKWILVGGYSRLPGRSLSGIESGSERYHIYKCMKCNLTGKKYPGGQIELDDKSFAGLDCNQVLVKDILE